MVALWWLVLLAYIFFYPIAGRILNRTIGPFENEEIILLGFFTIFYPLYALLALLGFLIKKVTPNDD